jgi:hypothetical protein
MSLVFKGLIYDPKKETRTCGVLWLVKKLRLKTKWKKSELCAGLNETHLGCAEHNRDS